MAQATFVHGNPLMIDHTPSGAVTAGDVVVIGDTPRVAHRDIAADALGALAIGGGVYDFAKTAGSGEALTDGAKVYWDDSANVATATSSGNKALGTVVEDAGDSATSVRVHHNPAI